MALSGVPIFFSGFWSKDEILHAAHDWEISSGPFYLGVFGALLTAFYMTRQVCYVFFGKNRSEPAATHAHEPAHAHDSGTMHAAVPHESSGVMTVPLVILAVFAVLLGFIGTPAWPWFRNYLTGERAASGLGELLKPGVVFTLSVSIVIVALGIGLGWMLYGRKSIERADEPDALERSRPNSFILRDIFVLFRNKFYVDEIYEATIIRFNAMWARFCAMLDFWVWNGLVMLVSYLVWALSWVSRAVDEFVVNLGFDGGCGGIRGGGRLLSRLQNGQVQSYLRVIGVALAALVLFLLWGCQAS